MLDVSITSWVVVGTCVQLMVHAGTKQQPQQQEAALKNLCSKLGLVGNQAGMLSYRCAALPQAESSTAAVLSRVSQPDQLTSQSETMFW